MPVARTPLSFCVALAVLVSLVLRPAGVGCFFAPNTCVADESSSSGSPAASDKGGNSPNTETKATAAKKTRADWAEIRLSGSFSESPQLPGLFGDIAESLPAVLERMNAAARDKSVKGVILHIDGLDVGWGKLNELQSAVSSIRAAGKPVWARLDEGGNSEYLLASECDRILMPESGSLMLTGVRAEVTFYKELLDKLSIQADMLRVGAFKSAGEPYTRTEMSPEFRLEMEAILDDYYSAMIAQITRRRGLTEQAVGEIIDEGILTAKRAKDLGLIDDLSYPDGIRSLIAAGDESLDVRIRDDYRRKKVNKDLDLFSLLEMFSGGGSDAGSTRPRIAVLRLEGPIVSGRAADPLSLLSESSISSDRIVPLIRKLTDDVNVRAIVLRVDSPGGSALASDLIWRALETCGKPVVASMSDTAASGGYYISMGADFIYAEPGTLTGSIGVVGGKIAVDGLMRRIGVNTTVLSRGRNSGVMSIRTEFSETERTAMQNLLNDIYEQFTQKAASGRRMDVDKLEELARGRVYTGRQARDLGLVDALGTLSDAVAHARRLAGDTEEKLELEDLPRAQNPLEMLFGRNPPAGRPFDAWARLLPLDLPMTMNQIAALRLLTDEPALVTMPFFLRIR